MPHPPHWYNRIYTGRNPGQTATSRLVTITVPPDAQAVGKSLGELTLPPGTFIVLVVQRQMPVQPAQDLELNAGDEVMTITLSDQEDALRDELTRVRREWAERQEQA
jgi:trk system potassium uptake protein TrkA